MTTGLAMVAYWVAGLMILTPLPGMLKAMVLVPTVAFALVMAQRKDPTPESLVLVTVNVAADATWDIATARIAAETSLATNGRRALKFIACQTVTQPACQSMRLGHVT